MTKTQNKYNRQIHGQVKVLLPFITAMCFMLLSCATTKLTAAWKDPAFHGTFRKIVVMGAVKSLSIRNTYEDEFVESLKAYGIDAVASYKIVPVEMIQDMGFVMEQIRETGADAVLITRLLDRKTQRIYVPGTVYTVPHYYHKWGHYYDHIYSPGYVVDEDYAYAETNIYTVHNEQIIWSAQSETLISDNNEKLISSFVKTIVDRLSASRLLGY